VTTHQVEPRESEQPEERGLLTINEVAAILGVNPTTARRWIKDGALEAVALLTPTRGHPTASSEKPRQILTPIRRGQHDSSRIGKHCRHSGDRASDLAEAHKLASYAEQNATREASAFIGDEYDWSHVGQLGDGAICREEDHG